MIEGVQYVSALVAGLTLGSFLNVCIYRIPRNLSVVKPRSFCPSCHTQIPFFFNIPVVSFLWLRGRCASCGARIAARYPIVELLTGVLSLVIVVRFGFSAQAVFNLLVVSGLIVVAFIDWDFKQIPRVLIYSIGAAALVLAAYSGAMVLQMALLGLCVGGGTLLLVAIIYKSYRGREGLGYGDVYLASVLGLYLGLASIPMLLVASSVSALAYGVAAARTNRLTFAVPFGSFLAFWGVALGVV